MDNQAYERYYTILMISNRLILTVTALSLAILSIETRAGVVYSDNFDSGTSPFTASAFFLDPIQEDGLIVKTTTGPTTFTDQITKDVSGSGYFLFNGTRNAGPPAGQTAFYISPSFTVTPNTTYSLSFYLTNSNYGDPGPGNPIFAKVQPELNGVAIASAFSAVGIWTTTGWQQFTFSFNSGSNSSEVLTLADLQSNGVAGGDFGVDEIVVQVPEPSSTMLVLVVLGCACVCRLRCGNRTGAFIN